MIGRAALSLAMVIGLAACGGGAPTVRVDTYLGDWSTVQAQADRECARLGLARAQFVGVTDRNVFTGSSEDVQAGDQRNAEFLCRGT